MNQVKHAGQVSKDNSYFQTRISPIKYSKRKVLDKNDSVMPREHSKLQRKSAKPKKTNAPDSESNDEKFVNVTVIQL
jgi:hypothetical protein